MDVYHVLNRGVEKRDIVQNDDDRMRFVRSLYIFNDIKNAPNSVSQPNQWNYDNKRTCLVHIHAWCLMNNHYHLLISPLDDDTQNISRFMKKLNMGYAKFFNEKYSRSGYLWQGKYKKILVDKDNYFDYIPYYIHLNPLDFTYKEWREGGVIDTQATYTVLENYRWSSYLDYNNKKNFPSLIFKNLLQDILGDSTNQRKMINTVISRGEQSHQTISKLIET